MNRNRRTLYLFCLVLISMWLAWTILVDFFVIRTIFQTIDNFFLAGDLGIALFLKLNNLELVTASILVSLFFIQFQKKKEILPLFIMSLLSWVIVMYYFSYLTPKLVMLTDIWKASDLLGLSSVKDIPDIQQEHQFFHRLYISLDTGKLLLLASMTGLAVIKADRWS